MATPRAQQLVYVIQKPELNFVSVMIFFSCTRALAKTVKAYLEAYYSDLLKATDEATTMSDNDNETSEAVTEAGNTGTQLNQFWVASFLCLCLSFTLHVVT